MPRGREFTLRANHPIRTPAITPLMVEPITMPTIWGLAAGAKRAVRPSKIPRIPPRTRPKTGLLMRPSCGLYLTRERRFLEVRSDSGAPSPANLSAQEEKDRRAHEEVSGDQEDRRPIFPEEATRALEK